jgi:pimeloyl-ACP methyl ester carboxylesterase
MKDKVGIIFVHGAGLGKFIWKDVQPNLNYPSLLIEFPNRNTDSKVNSKLSFEEYVVKAISDAQSFEKEKFIIVTHSIGGLIGLRITEHFKNKIIGFVGIGSTIPKNGKSFVSCLPFPQKLIVPLILKIAGTKPPIVAIKNGLCNNLNPEQTKTVIENFTAESKYLYIENSKSKIPNTKKLYIAMNNDKEFAFTVQKKMAKNLNCENIVTLNSGHLPMLSIPEKLSEVLNKFAYSCISKD